MAAPLTVWRGPPRVAETDSCCARKGIAQRTLRTSDSGVRIRPDGVAEAER
jgi:hypothetical protein